MEICAVQAIGQEELLFVWIGDRTAGEVHADITVHALYRAVQSSHVAVRCEGSNPWYSSD